MVIGWLMAVLALLLLLAPLDAALGAPLKRPAVRSRPLVLGAGPTAEPIADSGLLEPACSAANVVEARARAATARGCSPPHAR